MKGFLPKLFISICLIAVTGGFLKGQPAGLAVAPFNDGDSLASLIMGPGVSISNVYFNCPPGASGVALGTTSNLPFDTAVVLSNGNVQSAMGPNLNGATSDYFGTPGDTFLSIFPGLDTIYTHDACILQFDFVPLASPLLIDYVFASEEYPEYVCCPLADRFGFFITGQNPMGAPYNVTPFSVIPNSSPTIPIGVNSVNPGTLGSEPCATGSGCVSLNYSSLYNDNSSSSTEEVDGYTNSLTAPVLVFPCNTYTMRLSIADGGDLGPSAQELNSYVFIETRPANSPPVDAEFSVYLNTPYLIEGCLGGQLTVMLDTINPFPQTILIEHIGTATNGVDYNLPDTVTIPAGQETVNIPFTPILDNIPEPNDTIVLGLRLPCSNIFKTISIPIRDSLIINTSPDQTICEGDTIQIDGIAEGEELWWSPDYKISDTTEPSPFVYPLKDTTYSVTATIFQCTSTATVNITVNPAPYVDAGADTGVCQGQSINLNGDVQSGVNFQWIPLPGLVNPSNLNTPVSPPDTMGYILQVVDNKGCINRDTVVVDLNPLPSLTFGGSPKYVCRGDTTQIDISGNGTFEWQPDSLVVDPNVEDAFVFPTSVTNFNITLTDSNGCQTTKSLIVIPIDGPFLNAGPDKKICTNDTVTLTASGAPFYRWSPSAFLSDTKGNSVQAFPPNTMEFYVEAESFQGCKSYDTVLVETIPPPAISASANNSSVCPGDTILLSASSPASDYTWMPDSVVIDPDSSQTLAVVNGDLTFTVRVTDDIGCNGYDSVSITVNEVPTINTGQRDSICAGNSIQLNASGGVSYNWSPSSSLSDPNVSNPTASPINTTTYTLEVTNSFGCSGTDSTTIEVLPLPNVNAGQDLNLCAEDTAQLSATGAVDFAWSPSSGLGCETCASTDVSVSSSQTYTVVGTDQFGCKNSDEVEVNVLPLPAPSPTVDRSQICFGENVTLNASNGVSYQWKPSGYINNPNSKNPTATPDTTTMFTVFATDDNGCTGRDSVLVEVFGLPDAIGGGDDTICLGESIQLVASGGTVYDWSPGETLNDSTVANPLASPTQTTTYAVSVTNNLGCQSSDDITITVLDLPVIDAGGDQTVCEGDTVTLDVSGGDTYTWSPSANLSCASCASSEWYVNVTTTFTVAGTDLRGCTNYDTVTYTARPKPAVAVSPDTVICPDQPVQLEATGGVGFEWMPATALSDPNIAKPIATPGDPIVYTVIVTDDFGCQNKDSVSIDFYPNSNVKAGSDTAICAGETLRLNGSGTTSYSWSPAGSLNDPNVAEPIASPSTTTTYTVTGASANGCQSTDEVVVTVKPLPQLSVGSDSVSVCPGEEVQLSASGAASYSWIPVAGLSDSNVASPVASPTITTVYSVVGFTNAGCSDTAMVKVEVLPSLNPDVQPATAEVCYGDSIQLMAANGYNYNWKPNSDFIDPAAANPIAIPENDVTYTVELTDENGCTFIDSAVITVLPAAQVDAGMDQSIYRGGSVQLSGSGNGSLMWTPDKWLDDIPTIPNPSATPDSSITYTLRVTTADGCEATDNVFIKVFLETEVKFPNAFSPNGDGINELFGPVIYNEIEIQYFRIYNRWGEIVFSTTETGEKWDGTVNGTKAPMGTYIYQFEGTGNKGKVIKYQGNITLIR